MNLLTASFPLLLALAVTQAPAQTAPSESTPGRGAPVVTDVAPAPAEDRDSPGAVVLDDRRVRAQREKDAQAPRSMGAPPAARDPLPELRPPDRPQPRSPHPAPTQRK